jgi:hypothetical protein
LSNPKSYNEKLQWLKFNWFDETAQVVVDKLRVRKYLEDIGYGKYLNQIYGVYDSFDQIDFSSLPEISVIKTTHSSGGVFIYNKGNTNLSELRAKVNKDLSEKYNQYNFEWVYDACVPRIIIERYIGHNGVPPNDYKFFCFHGEPKLLYVATDRNTNTKFTFFDLNWNKLIVKNHYDFVQNESLSKPENFQLMLDFCRIVSRKFPHVRVDLYDFEGQIIFGELTFFHFSGKEPFEPREYDYKIGSYLNIEKIKNKKYMED